MLFQALVLNSFSKLRRGSLELTLPEGKVLRFGGLGKQSCAQIAVRNREFWKRCVLYGPIGFAESYIAGEWDTPDLTRLLAFFILNNEDLTAMRKPDQWGPPALDLLGAFNRWRHLRRPNSLPVARTNIRDHYDLGNDFFELWLDSSMTYSAAVFDPPTATLEQAQHHKYDLLCQKLRLSPADHLLEIGSGWGGMSMHAARHFGCRVTTVTISEAQFHEAGRRIRDAGLGDRVEVELRDYRLLRGQFDKLVSIEMLEAVGDRYLETFFAKCNEVLKPRGLMALQMITCPDRQFPVLRNGVDFVQKHIFPGSLLLSLRRLTEAMYRTGDWQLLGWEDFGLHYARTLQIWRQNFAQAVPRVLGLGYDQTFVRKWNYYLSYCEAAFATRHIGVVQALYSRPDNILLPGSEYRQDWAD